MECDGTPYSVANVAHSILKKKYIYSSNEGRLFCFNGNCWIHDSGYLNLSYDLSGKVVRSFESPNEVLVSSTKRRNIIFKLKKSLFKSKIILILKSLFLDNEFTRRLDVDTNLLAFTNGVWDFKANAFRKATREDYVSNNVGYDFNPDIDLEFQEKVNEYWNLLHPDKTQRDYTINLLLLQLQGNHKKDIHIHKDLVGIGRSSFMRILQKSLGDYTTKLFSEVLTKPKLNIDKLMPIDMWRGKRIMICNETKKINLDTLGFLLDTDKIEYKDGLEFKPQFHIHMKKIYKKELNIGKELNYVSKFDFNKLDLDNPKFTMEFLRRIFDGII